MRLRDWLTLRLIRRSYIVHLRTDPACKDYRAPLPGSSLEWESRGFSCARCAGRRV